MRKRAAGVGTPEFVDIGARTADHARLGFRWAQMQLEMAHESAARLERGDQPPNVHLIEVEPRPIDRVLALWREAQIRLEIARPGSPEAAAAVEDIERFREEYQIAHEAAIAATEQASVEGS